MVQWVSVARVGEIEDKASRVITLNDADIAVFNLGGEYFAIEDLCTHDGGDISGG